MRRAMTAQTIKMDEQSTGELEWMGLALALASTLHSVSAGSSWALDVLRAVWRVFAPPTAIMQVSGSRARNGHASHRLAQMYAPP